MIVAAPRVSVTVASSRACPATPGASVNNQTVIANPKSSRVKPLPYKENGMTYLDTDLINCERSGAAKWLWESEAGGGNTPPGAKGQNQGGHESSFVLQLI